MFRSSLRRIESGEWNTQCGYVCGGISKSLITSPNMRQERKNVSFFERNEFSYAAVATHSSGRTFRCHRTQHGLRGITVSEITHRTVETNGIHMHIAESGAGPLVVLCHGFPESWYSWRHQLHALAEAGFHAVAPDMRGYGQTDRPAEIERYTLLHLVGDMVGLLDALGAPTAVIAGHDWGAPVAWHAALLRPDRFRAVIGLSVPFRPRG